VGHVAADVAVLYRGLPVDDIRAARPGAVYVLPGEGQSMTAVTRDVLLTPTLARRWLANAANVRINDDLVRLYRDAMAEGRWRHGSLMVMHGRQLHDGAHRCLAVIESGAAVWVRCVTVRDGVDPEPEDVPPPVLPLQAAIPDGLRR
jgi:hypothetical protein